MSDIDWARYGFYNEFYSELELPERCRPGSGHSPQNDCGCWAGVVFSAPLARRTLTDEELTPAPEHYLIAARLVHEGWHPTSRRLRYLDLGTESHRFTVKVFRAFKHLTRRDWDGWEGIR